MSQILLSNQITFQMLIIFNIPRNINTNIMKANIPLTTSYIVFFEKIVRDD